MFFSLKSLYIHVMGKNKETTSTTGASDLKKVRGWYKSKLKTKEVDGLRDAKLLPADACMNFVVYCHIFQHITCYKMLYSCFALIYGGL
jgi:hypothetical protein